MAISTNGAHLADTARCHFNMLTTSLGAKSSSKNTTACTAQSGLTPVCSVECGLFA